MSEYAYINITDNRLLGGGLSERVERKTRVKILMHSSYSHSRKLTVNYPKAVNNWLVFILLLRNESYN